MQRNTESVDCHHQPGIVDLALQSYRIHACNSRAVLMLDYSHIPGCDPFPQLVQSGPDRGNKGL